MSNHKVIQTNIDRVRQGDIFKNIRYLESYSETNGDFEIKFKEFPYVLVMTQDCDLEQNKIEREKNNIEYADKILFSIMVLPLYNAEHLTNGNHLEEINIKTQKISGSELNKLKQNKLDRYHYISFEDQIEIPNSVIDFKHCFSVSLQLLEDNLLNRIGSIDELYREHISQRFCSFLSRIGLP